jgi:hypothetical protein
MRALSAKKAESVMPKAAESRPEQRRGRAHLAALDLADHRLRDTGALGNFGQCPIPRGRSRRTRAEIVLSISATVMDICLL